MRAIRRGAHGAAVVEIRGILSRIGLLADTATDQDPQMYDDAVERAVRTFQQTRDLSVDGMVGDETWRALDAARWRLGQRTLFHSVTEPLVGEDVHHLQERLLEMGYDVGRADAVYGGKTARAVWQFQREMGLRADGECGPQTLGALRRLGRKVVGGRPQLLRESVAVQSAGPALPGKRIVIDPGHGGPDHGIVVFDGQRRLAEADIVYDIASRLEGRLAAIGMRVHLTRGPSPAEKLPDADRARLANDLGADLFISLHAEAHSSQQADGVATYHYGSISGGVTSTIGERLAAMVQREIVVRAGMRDCQIHPKRWELLRLTRMPAVQVDLGYLTSPVDRVRLCDPMFRDRIVEAMMAGVQRMYLPLEWEVETGSIDVSKLRALMAAGDR